MTCIWRGRGGTGFSNPARVPTMAQSLLFAPFMPNTEKPSVESFSVQIDTVPIPEDAKNRLIKNFQKSLLQELALHDSGVSIVLLDPRKGGKFIKNAHLASEMKIKDLIEG